MSSVPLLAFVGARARVCVCVWGVYVVRSERRLTLFFSLSSDR